MKDWRKRWLFNIEDVIMDYYIHDVSHYARTHESLITPTYLKLLWAPFLALTGFFSPK